jgi:uncharacterized protein YndB with AHSA1/START domain
MIIDGRTVRVTHRYAQSAERVFDAWLDPAIARRFLFATPTGEMVRAETDPRVGGKFVFTDRRDGQEVEHVGEYRVIERPRRLVFSFGVPLYSAEMTEVEIDIAPLETGGCELTLTQRDIPPDYAGRNVRGWTMILESLERALA